jgi:hypothetical protein
LKFGPNAVPNSWKPAKSCGILHSFLVFNAKYIAVSAYEPCHCSGQLSCDHEFSPTRAFSLDQFEKCEYAFRALIPTSSLLRIQDSRFGRCVHSLYKLVPPLLSESPKCLDPAFRKPRQTASDFLLGLPTVTKRFQWRFC